MSSSTSTHEKRNGVLAILGVDVRSKPRGLPSGTIAGSQTIPKVFQKELAVSPPYFERKEIPITGASGLFIDLGFFVSARCVHGESTSRKHGDSTSELLKGGDLGQIAVRRVQLYMPPEPSIARY